MFKHRIETLIAGQITVVAENVDSHDVAKIARAIRKLPVPLTIYVHATDRREARDFPAWMLIKGAEFIHRKSSLPSVDHYIKVDSVKRDPLKFEVTIEGTYRTGGAVTLTLEGTRVVELCTITQ